MKITSLCRLLFSSTSQSYVLATVQSYIFIPALKKLSSRYAFTGVILCDLEYMMSVYLCLDGNSGFTFWNIVVQGFMRHVPFMIPN